MAKGKEPTYKEAVSEIDAILAAIEGEEELDIDALAEKVERAAALIRLCNERLKKAETRVRKVTAELASARGEAADKDASDSDARDSDASDGETSGDHNVSASEEGARKGEVPF